MTAPAAHEPHRPEGVSAPEELPFALPAPARLGPARAATLALVGLAALGAAFLAGLAPRVQARAALASGAAEASRGALRVEIATPKIASSDRAITLPGTVQPLEEIVLYPRASGYVRKWLVDMGDVVKEGQLLAEIDTPEVEQELEQARAQLEQAEATLVQAKANRELSRAGLARYQQLTPAGLASQQDLEQRQAQAAVDDATVRVAEATVLAQRANTRRLTQLQAFSRVTAPFAGTITARSVDRGTLVAPGTATPLFKLSATDPVRVFVDVPQDLAPSVHAGAAATVTLREYPGRAFEGRVTRAAGALDAATRTMSTEVRVPNADHAILAGMYAQVALTLPVPHRVIELPATAVMNDAAGLRVATIDPQGKVHQVPITIERDTGTTVLVATGLTGDERVIRLARADLAEGRAVEIVTPAPAASSSAK